MTIDEVIDALILREGGFSNDPHDRGGPTRFGITESEARASGYNGSMELMPKATAKAIYLVQYWTGPHLDRVDMLSPRIAEELLDTGVNMGTTVPIRFLQRVLNAFNDSGKLYPDLEVDGYIGNRTIAALDALLNHRDKEDGEVTILKAMDALQGARYIELAEARETNEDFVYGWIRNRLT